MTALLLMPKKNDVYSKTWILKIPLAALKLRIDPFCKQ
jgi:hypothetical protein